MFNHDLSLTIPFPDGHIAAQLQCPAIAEVNGKTARQKVMAHRSLALIHWMNSLMPDQCSIVRVKSLNRWWMKVELHRMRVKTKGKVQRPLLLFITIHIHIYYLVPGASQPLEDTNASHPAGDGAVEDSEPTPPPPPIPSQQSSPPPNHYQSAPSRMWMRPLMISAVLVLFQQSDSIERRQVEETEERAAEQGGLSVAVVGQPYQLQDAVTGYQRVV